MRAAIGAVADRTLLTPVEFEDPADPGDPLSDPRRPDPQPDRQHASRGGNTRLAGMVRGQRRWIARTAARSAGGGGAAAGGRAASGAGGGWV